MARWSCALALLLCIAVHAPVWSADEAPEPAKNDHPSPAHAPADKRSCCRKLWEFVTFRFDPTPRHCQNCLAYPLEVCTPPLYRFFETRYTYPAAATPVHP